MARITRQWLRKPVVTKNEKGITLAESAVTVAIVGVVLVTFASALSTGTIAVGESDQQVAMQSLARTQMEYIKGYPYDSGATTYPAVDTTDNYSISVGVTSIPDTDANIQKVTANISRNGQLLLTVEDYKVNR
jgi:type II secretory pathway pseudopilin PulG